jgi:hypothetical protein
MALPLYFDPVLAELSEPKISLDRILTTAILNIYIIRQTIPNKKRR